MGTFLIYLGIIVGIGAFIAYLIQQFEPDKIPSNIDVKIWRLRYYKAGCWFFSLSALSIAFGLFAVLMSMLGGLAAVTGIGALIRELTRGLP
jgi:hypothetical protein